jgi:hypothetical protein
MTPYVSFAADGRDIVVSGANLAFGDGGWAPLVMAVVGVVSLGDLLKFGRLGDDAIALGDDAIEATAAGGGGSLSFEIVDGVRRAKAAELAGHTSIPANVEVGGRVVETIDVPLSSLYSPFKSAIDITSSPSAMQRFQSVLNGTRSGDPLPPITVQPGSRGPSIFDVFFE